MDSAVRAAEKEVKKGELEGEQKFRQMEAHFLTNTTSWNSMTNAERKTALESEMLYLNKLNEITEGIVSNFIIKQVVQLVDR